MLNLFLTKYSSTMMEKSRSDPAFQGEEVETGSFFKVWLSEVLSGVAVLKM